MHACSILLCISLNLLYYASLLNKKVSVRVWSPMVGLKVVYPILWVAGNVRDWYQSLGLKHWAGMGRVY
jgi:hypothetical protein